MLDSLNKKIEKMAIDAVKKFERKKGRNPKDVSKQHKGYDVYSSGRRIEVKGIKKSFKVVGSWRFLQQKSLQVLLQENRYFIYIVDNLKHRPPKEGIYIISRKDALKFLKVKPAVVYSFRVPVNRIEDFRFK